MRRDECGDWAIWGSNGHVYAVAEGFQMMIGCDFDNSRWSSAKGWESAKRRLAFGKVAQDGDMEGSIILARLPAKSEADTIREVLGIPKRVELSAGQLANLKAHAAVNAFKPVLPASSISDATKAAAMKAFEELKTNDCRWPMAPGFFCADAASPGRPYCMAHTALARRPNTNMVRRAPPPMIRAIRHATAYRANR